MFTVLYSFQEFAGTQLGSWILASLPAIGTALLSIVITKLRAKAAIIAAKDGQISELSGLVLRLTDTIEKLGQMFTLAFVESKGLTAPVKMEIARLAKTMITDVKSEAAKAIDIALNLGKDAVAKQAIELLNKAQEKADALIGDLTIQTDIPQVDELT